MSDGPPIPRLDDLDAARGAIRPSPVLEREIRAHLVAQLGRVLPSDERRGLGWYYDWVVLGERSLEALSVFGRHAPPPGLPLLDVGSGLGTFVLLARRVGFDAIGVEPGREEIELARRRAQELGPAGDPFRAGVGEELPLEDGSAGGVLLHDVLEHVGDWRTVLRECRRVLAPRGVLYVKGPSYAVRFVEPHYRVPWLPLLPKGIARPYLASLGRDTDYLRHIGYRRRGEVLAALRALGFELRFPRRDKLAQPDAINRAWVRGAVEAVDRVPGLRSVARRLADNPLQSTIDVVAVAV